MKKILLHVCLNTWASESEGAFELQKRRKEVAS